jgi:m7GpppX diphosphatase
MTSTTRPDVAAHVESLIPKFHLTRLLNSDQAGRRISLLGTIDSKPALLIAERAAFDTSPTILNSFSTSLRNIKNQPPPDFKLNLIYPCTEKHVKKYEQQRLRIVTETPEIYAKYVRPYMQAQREKGALNWVFNIIEGRTEQEDVMYRESGEDGFLLLPDLNWDRKTMGSLHLLGLVERRDIWSIRDLKKGMVEWVKHMREKMVEAAIRLYPEIERDELKLYVHCKFTSPRVIRALRVLSSRTLQMQDLLMMIQTNRHTTTFTSILYMSLSKPVVHKLQEKPLVWRTPSLNWK